MLVLTRKAGESLRIGSNIIITILETSPGSIKVGIKAPQEVPVHREEVYKRIQEENRQAMSLNLDSLKSFRK
ncbi:MAG TPA: carbon storage regulator [Candidatus Marinimicrobia bacterium]|nr:carbon storage regulator [Candidatus Neomarinimicrobiota bacterium]